MVGAGGRLAGTVARKPNASPTGPRDRGASTLELAIVFPAVLAMLFGAIQAATYFTARSAALTAAQSAVSAERGFGAPAGSGRERAETFLANTGDWLTVTAIDINRDADEVTVTVTGTALSVVPGKTFVVTETAHGTIERFTGGP